MHILGLKKCREPRDYIFALGGMIGFKEDDSRPLLARDHFEHFCSLATHALRMGDYTPLLLSPLPEEQSVPRAPWLRGHPGMSELLWDLGVCHRRARRQDIVKDGLIQPILEAVGVVEWFEHRNFAGSPETVLMDITPQILLSSGTCPEAFGAAVDRILIRTEDTALYTEWESPYIRKPPRPPYDHSSLVKILQEFSTLQHGTESEQTALQKLDLSGRIIELLDLENPGKKAADSRLDIAHAQAQWYTDKYGREMDGLCRIRCRSCARRSLSRLTLWDIPKPESAQVHRIPGLLFDETIPEGVGLVICDGVLIGKMMYGTPACECHRLGRVNLGSARLWSRAEMPSTIGA
ncbi:hypothetical protein ACJZ2D_013124 [Fusarium nematophilum]